MEKVLVFLLISCCSSLRIPTKEFYKSADFITESHINDRMEYWDKVASEITPDTLVIAEGHYISSHGKEKGQRPDPNNGKYHHGGDRMKRHNYAPEYSKYLTKLLEQRTLNEAPSIVEIGILTGTGLAMWSELFPESSIFGFDLDPLNYEGNRDHLKAKGFIDTHVSVGQMDQMNDNRELLKTALKGAPRPSIVIDDGCHASGCHLPTFNSILPMLNERFVYFLEDVPSTHEKPNNPTAASQEALDKMKEACPNCEVEVTGRYGPFSLMAVISRL